MERLYCALRSCNLFCIISKCVNSPTKNSKTVTRLIRISGVYLNSINITVVCEHTYKNVLNDIEHLTNLHFIPKSLRPILRALHQTNYGFITDAFIQSLPYWICLFEMWANNALVLWKSVSVTERICLSVTHLFTHRPTASLRDNRGKRNKTKHWIKPD